jgi:hypothetical protein
MATSTGTKADPLDLDTLAVDLVDLFDKFRYPHLRELGDDEIRAALPVFLAALGRAVDGSPFEPAADAEPATPPAYTEHTCASKAAGGNYAPGCPRCTELAAGAPPRSAPDWVHRMYAARTTGHTAYAAEIKAHFGKNGRHATHCMFACTFTW